MRGSQSSQGPLIILGIDAGDLSLMQRWLCDGSLPNLQRMRDEGAWAPLENTALRTCIFDVPKMWPFAGVNGIQVLEWGAKSPADNPRSDPPELVDVFKCRYGIHRGTLLDEDITESPGYFRNLLQALVESARLYLQTPPSPYAPCTAWGSMKIPKYLSSCPSCCVATAQ